MVGFPGVVSRDMTLILASKAESLHRSQGEPVVLPGVRLGWCCVSGRLTDVAGQCSDGLSCCMDAGRRQVLHGDGFRDRRDEVRQVRCPGNEQPVDASRQGSDCRLFE